jgi:hypothetical protein
MALIYISPLVNIVVYVVIAFLAMVVTYYALIAGRRELEMDEAQDNLRLVERRTLN